MDISSAPQLLTAFERRFRHDHLREHALLLDPLGHVVAQNIGGFDNVAFDPADLEIARGGLLTHTHPRGLPFSGADLTLAAEYGLTMRAVGNAPDTGQQFDYTVRAPIASKSTAKRIARVFDDYLEQAEKELAKAPFGDLAWQRESRHLAVSRIASDFALDYQRVERRAALSEATSHERARLDFLAGVDPALKSKVLDPLRVQIIAALTRVADGSGKVPVSQLSTMQQTVGRLAVQTMLGAPKPDGSLSPYTVQHGQVQAGSPFFAMLWSLMRHGAQLAIDRHAAMMRKYLPPDVVRQFEFATISPFKSELSEAEGDETFVPLQYDPLHLWIGPDGKQLSDRIWNATGDLTRKLNNYLAEAISRGTPVQQMARELEQFLVSGGAYETYRLARTETAAAISRADSAAAQMNPLVETYTPVTAPRHQCCDECDDEEAGGPYPKSDMRHLPPFHPLCICTVIWHMVQSIPKTVKRLRDQIASAVSQAKKAVTDFITPLSRRFIDLLFRGRN